MQCCREVTTMRSQLCPSRCRLASAPAAHAVKLSGLPSLLLSVLGTADKPKKAGSVPGSSRELTDKTADSPDLHTWNGADAESEVVRLEKLVHYGV